MSNRMDLPARILIVEDNPGDVRLIQEAFQETQLAHEVAVARDGLEALEFLFRRGSFSGQLQPHLILLDLNLPKKGGREVLAEVKSDANLLHVPVVVFSSSAALPDVSGAYKLHANCYVTKPADLDEMFSVIGSITKFWLGTATLPHAS